MHSFGITAKHIGPRVWLRVGGETNDALEHCSMADVTKDDGLHIVLKILDQAFGPDQGDAVKHVVEQF